MHSYIGTCGFCRKDLPEGRTRHCSKKCRDADNGLDYLKRKLAEIHDDFTRPWSDYPCVEWDRSRKGKGVHGGYGQIMRPVDGTRIVTRIAYSLSIGPVPANLHVCHHCDNPPCFRPIHLFVGSDSDNIRDCISKGRLKIWEHKGILHPLAKLTEDDVIKIRGLYAGGMPQRRIGLEFSISQSEVSLIVLRKHWSHVK